MSLLSADIFMHAWNDKKLFSRLTGFNTYVSNFDFIENDAWFDMDWFDEIMTSHSNDDPDVFIQFTKRGYVAGEKLVHFCRQMELEGKNRDSLGEIFWRSAKLLQNLVVFIPITHPLSKLIEKRVIEILKQHGVSDTDITDRLLEVSVPVKNNGPEQELIDLKKIKNHMFDPSYNLEGELTKHWQKYSYLGYRDLFSNGYPIEFFRNSLQEEHLDEMGLDHAPPDTFRFSSEEEKTINLFKEFVWFRNYRTEKFFEALFFLEPLYTRLSLEYQLDEHDLFYYLLNEVSRLFIHEERVPADELEIRKRGNALLLDDNHFFLLTGDQLKRKEEELEEHEDENLTEIRGMVVCRGCVQGAVSVVHNNSELDKVKEGEILVTGMTTPDYIPALRKAAAFVTDEGGVTCHAAIVARELKKPCIVGTKRATQLLRDGELVEVDANAGIIRILS